MGFASLVFFPSARAQCPGVSSDLSHRMVLQNKYKRAASARYAQSSTGAASSAPSPRPRPPKPNRSPSPPTGSSELPDGEDSLGDGPPRTFRRRELGTNAGRYEEVEVEETESDVEAENEGTSWQLVQSLAGSYLTAAHSDSTRGGGPRVECIQ